MEPLLFLCHRIPYPPHKGDKIHAYHLLHQLRRRYRILLGTFVDDPSDLQHVDTVRAWCADAWFGTVSPRVQKVRSLSGLLTGEPLSVVYYRHRGLRAWIERALARHGVRKALAYSSALAPYVVGRRGVRAVLDIADLDSAKWSQYAPEHRWPMSALYRREGRRLLQFECDMVRRADAAFFATVAEARLLLAHAPDVAAKVFGVPNGVDAEYFAPDAARPSPYAAREQAIVFTGAMDYWPNVDAACWFAEQLMPRIVAQHPRARFYAVGMNPAPAVSALARLPYVTVTGRVDDVRPYLQHAALFVAPLRLARGIQNKVLEAMAMQCAAIVSTGTLTGVRARPGQELVAAADGDEFVAQVCALLGTSRAEQIGRAARARVRTDYDWATLMAGYEKVLEAETMDTVDLPGCRPLAEVPA